MHECCPFLSLAGKKEPKLSAADPAGRVDSMEELVRLALVKCLKSRAGKDSEVRIYASLESKSSCCLTAKKLFLSAQNHRTRQTALPTC